MDVYTQPLQYKQDAMQGKFFCGERLIFFLLDR